MPHSLEDKLVEEEDEDIPNIRGIKRKNPLGWPKNQKDGLHSRFKDVLAKNHGTSKSSSKTRTKQSYRFRYFMYIISFWFMSIFRWVNQYMYILIIE